MTRRPLVVPASRAGRALTTMAPGGSMAAEAPVPYDRTIRPQRAAGSISAEVDEYLFGYSDHGFASLMYRVPPIISPSTQVAVADALYDSSDATALPVWYDSDLETMWPYVILPAVDVPVGQVVTSVQFTARVRILQSLAPYDVDGYSPGTTFRTSGIGFYSNLLEYGIYDQWSRETLLAARASQADGAVWWDVWGWLDDAISVTTDWVDYTWTHSAPFVDWTGYSVLEDAFRRGVMGFDFQPRISPPLWDPPAADLGGIEVASVSVSVTSV